MLVGSGLRINDSFKIDSSILTNCHVYLCYHLFLRPLRLTSGTSQPRFENVVARKRITIGMID